MVSDDIPETLTSASDETISNEEVVAVEPVPAATGRGVKAIGQTVVARVLIQGLNAGTGVLTARLLMPAGRGQLAAITLWSSFLAGMTTFGLPSALIYYIRNRPKQTGDLLVNGLVMSTLLSIVAAVVGVIWMPHWLHQYPAWAIRSAQWFLIVTPLCSTAFVIRGALEASGAFKTSNVAQLLNPAVTLATLLGLLVVHRFNTFTAALAYILAAFPVFGLLLWQARHLFTGNLRPSLASSRLLLSYGIRSYGIDLLGTLALQVDQVLVVSFLTPADLGLYVVVLSLSRMLNVFQLSVVMVLFPKAAGRSQEDAVALTGRAARMSLLLTGACAVSVAVIGPLLLRLFYGPAYARSALSLRILLAEVTISGCLYVLAQAFMALGRPGTVTLLQAMGLALSVPLMVLLIPRWGIAGAAFSLLVSTCARFTFIYVSFPLILKIAAPSLLPQREDVEMLRRALKRFGRSEAR